MAEWILQLFAGKEKASELLANPLIEFIFTILFVLFIAAVIVHVSIYMKLKKLKNDTNRTDLYPVSDMKQLYETRRQTREIQVETFVQEQFSGWRMLGIPVITLIKMVSATVSLFILIGVLGTFIGLTMSLGTINASSDQLAENVAAVLAGVDVAFYTSIAGMGLSLIMTVLVKAFNTEDMLTDIMLKVESELESAGENAMDRLITVSEGIQEGMNNLRVSNEQSMQNIANAFSGFQDYTTGLQQAAGDLAQFNEGLGNNLQAFEALFHSMKSVTDGFTEETQKLNNHFDALFSYFKKMDAKQENLVKTVESIQEDVNQTADTQANTMEQLKSSATDFETVISQMVDEQKSTNSSFEKMNQQTSEHVKALEAQNKAFQNIFGSNVSTQMSDITKQLSGLKQGFDQISQTFVRLPEALDGILRTQGDYKQLLNERFEAIKSFNQSFSEHLRSHQEGARNFEANMETASRTFEQIGRQNQQVIKELNSTVNDIQQMSGNRENQMEERMEALRAALTSFSDHLERTVADKMDQAARNLNSSIESMSDDIRKEYKALGRSAEERQQQDTRQMKQVEDMLKELTDSIHALARRLEDESRSTTHSRYDRYEE